MALRTRLVWLGALTLGLWGCESMPASISLAQTSGVFAVEGVKLGMLPKEAETTLKPKFGQSVQRSERSYSNYGERLEGSEHLVSIAFGAPGAGNIIVDRMPGTGQTLGLYRTEILWDDDPRYEMSLDDITQMFVEAYGIPTRTILDGEQGQAEYDRLHLWLASETSALCEDLEGEAQDSCNSQALEYCKLMTAIGGGDGINPFYFTQYPTSDRLRRYQRTRICGEMLIVTMRETEIKGETRTTGISQMLIDPGKWYASQEAYYAHWKPLAEAARD